MVRLLASAATVVFAAVLIGCATSPSAVHTAAVPDVGRVPDFLRQTLELSDFYQKHIQVRGYPILGSTNVSDYAMREAAWIIAQMTAHRPEILEAMATNRGRLVVMAHNEYTTDVPEQAGRLPKVFWDRRARGLGGRLTSCAEENLLGYPNDPYSAENILIHEFAHAIMAVGMRALDPTFNGRVRDAFHEATQAGLWKNTYAGSNPQEYWAEGVQSWFDDNRENDSVHNHVNTRAELKAYDPRLAKLCEEVLGDLSWRYQKPSDRATAERAHLRGYDPSAAPAFRWRDVPITERPRVLIQTELGDIEVELHPGGAPLAVSNFVYCVREGFYRNGLFSQAIRDGAGFIQAEVDPARASEWALFQVREHAGDRPVQATEGTLCLLSDGPETARAGFAIAVGVPPGPQGGKEHELDGFSFTPLGRVIKGMDVVKRIHESPTDGPWLKPPIEIRAAYRLE